MRKIITRIVTLITLFVVLITSLSIPAHASSKSTITKQIDGFLNATKRYNHKKMQKYLIDKNIPYIKDKKYQKHIKKLNRNHLNYEIKSIKVKQNTAIAKLHISFYSAYEDGRTAVKSVAHDYQKSWSNQRVWNELRDSIISEYYYASQLDDNDFKTTYIFDLNLKIRLKKQGKTWKIVGIPRNKAYFIDSALYDFLNDFSRDPLKAMDIKR